MAVADAKVTQAEAEKIRARGEFDLKAYAEGMIAPVGKYERPYGEFGLKQATRAYGIELYAKYQNGADFAPYDGDYVTSEAGKIALGVIVPLLRGGATDAARFERYKADLEMNIAEQGRRGQRAELLAAAAEAWWKWAVTGKKLSAYRKLVSQAVERRDFVREQARVGAIAPIEVTDNERLLAARKATLAVLELEFRRSGLKLGLYRRGQGNQPLPASEEELPADSWALSSYSEVSEAFIQDLENAPALQIYQTTLEVLDAELKLAKNDQLPNLNLELFSTGSFGEPRPYSVNDDSVSEATAGGKLSFAWDVQRRKSRGKAGVIRAKKTVIEQEARLLRDTLRLDVEAQLAALQAQRAVADLSRQATDQADQVKEAEVASFEAGQSSILSVNLRERAVLSAYIAELEAIFEYQMAWVALQRLLGRDAPEAYLPLTTQEPTSEEQKGTP
jgi:outer membrane protein TolC